MTVVVFDIHHDTLWVSKDYFMNNLDMYVLVTVKAYIGSKFQKSL